MQVSFQGLGWKVILHQKNTNYFLSLVKEIVLGNALKRNDELFYYLVSCNKRKAIIIFLDGNALKRRDELFYYLVTCNKRNAILVFLDGKGRPNEEIVKLKGNSFIISK
jgi:hypothetical protein